MGRAYRPWRRHLSVTREGKVFVLVTLGVGIGAINTSNNLLYLVLALMLSLIVISGILAESAIRPLHLVRGAPQRVRQGEEFWVELTVRNTRRWFPVMSVELRDTVDGARCHRSVFFLRVGARERRSIAYRCTVARRGTIPFGAVHVSTRFPFGLFEKSRDIPLPATIIAWPAPRADVRVPQVRSTGTNAETAAQGGPGDDYWQMRPYREGDDWRMVHPKVSARARRPMVRETRREQGLEVRLHLPRPQRPELLESAVGVAAAAVQAVLDAGGTVVLSTFAGGPLTSGGWRLWDHLALLSWDHADVSGTPIPQDAWIVTAFGVERGGTA